MNSISKATNTDEAIILAKWLDRFLAWLIDFLIISIPLWRLLATIYLYSLIIEVHFL